MKHPGNMWQESPHECLVKPPTVSGLHATLANLRRFSFVSSVCHCQRMALTVYALNLEEIHVRVIIVSLSVYGPYSICSETWGDSRSCHHVRVISVSLSVYGPYGICSETWGDSRTCHHVRVISVSLSVYAPYGIWSEPWGDSRSSHQCVIVSVWSLRYMLWDLRRFSFVSSRSWHRCVIVSVWSLQYNYALIVTESPCHIVSGWFCDLPHRAALLQMLFPVFR